MPAQLKRYYGGADLHFITFSCFHRQPKLQPSANKDLFLAVLEQVRQKYRFAVFGYVVMPEHVHLLLSQPEVANPSTVMQVLKQVVSRTISLDDKCASLGGFWQRRFYDFNVRTEPKRSEKLRYMHRNPVIRGLAKPEDWQWSSFRYYAFDDPSPVMIDSSWLNHWQPDLDPTLRKGAKDGAPVIKCKHEGGDD